MEVDNDIDSQLLQQFSSLGTNDREVLIAEFQRLLGDQLSAAACAFYLDMNNWNLQAAICSYYDLQHPTVKLPSMSFVKDVTIGEGESIPPCTNFVKTWRIQNSGDDAWPPGCCLQYVNGAKFGDRDRTMVSGIQPGAVTDVSVEMVSPAEAGLHQGQWRMSTATGTFFGEFIWVIIHVEDNGLMGVTQQLSQIGNDFIHPTSPTPLPNPFASPTKNQHDQSSSPNPQFSTLSQSHLLGGVPTVSNGLTDSPMGSDIAEHGSFPNSPCVPSHAEINQEGRPTLPSDGVRTALFQGAEATNAFSSDVMNLQDLPEQKSSSDSVEMS